MEDIVIDPALASAPTTKATVQEVPAKDKGITPNNIPLSPASAGARTPKATRQPLNPDVVAQDGKTSELTSGMDDLKVQSPVVGEAPGISQILAQNEPSLPEPQHERMDSSSTESGQSSAAAPSFGSSYGIEGFPIGTNIGEDGSIYTPADLNLSAQAAAAIAAADEAIKQINGTATVFNDATPSFENPYALPRGYAGFTKPQNDGEGNSNIHRQSSLSSNTTESASTSSEESDLCVPSLEWVNLPTVVSPGSGMLHPTQPATKGLRSPGRMPPPALARNVASPRPGPAHQQSLPLGATAHTPGGLKQSALPSDVVPHAPAEDEDDDQTVGNGRDRASSTSSQSAQSGLDLLWRAAQHPPEGPNTQSPYDQPYDSKGKRKAGAEAVAQWRNSGIPSGDASKPEEGKPQSGLPKKRRRSEIAIEAIDPALRDPDMNEFVVDMEASETPSQDDDAGSEDGSEYQGGRLKGKGAVKQKAGAGGKKGGKAGGRASTGTAAANGVSGKAGGSGKKARKNEDPNGGDGGEGNGGNGGGSRRASSGAPAVGVQCEYVNPLPPYNRCQDIFTRKYDLPRHMARHARREGELVFEGKLAEDKALLWKTIKDKPKVTCGSCGESFTRMDALKRHQTKQGHSG